MLLNGLQLVVIQLEADEDSQEIFETLNARGTPLTAADLIKNFVFQRLDLPAAESEAAYEKHWKLFETAFWEKEVGAGRNAMARSSLFLNQWLIAQTAENIGVREVFSRFKYFTTHDLDTAMGDLLPAIHRAALDYQSWTEAAHVKDGVLDRLTLFVYRIGALDSEATKPLLIWLRDPASGSRRCHGGGPLSDASGKLARSQVTASTLHPELLRPGRSAPPGTQGES